MSNLPIEAPQDESERRAELLISAVEAGADIKAALLHAGYSPNSDSRVLDSASLQVSLNNQLRRRLSLAAFTALQALESVARSGKPLEKVAAAKAIKDWAGMGLPTDNGGKSKDLTEMSPDELHNLVSRAHDVMSLRAKPAVIIDSAPVTRQSDSKPLDLLD